MTTVTRRDSIKARVDAGPKRPATPHRDSLEAPVNPHTASVEAPGKASVGV